MEMEMVQGLLIPSSKNSRAYLHRMLKLGLCKLIECSWIARLEAIHSIGAYACLGSFKTLIKGPFRQDAWSPPQHQRNNMDGIARNIHCCRSVELCTCMH